MESFTKGKKMLSCFASFSYFVSCPFRLITKWPDTVARQLKPSFNAAKFFIKFSTVMTATLDRPGVEVVRATSLDATATGLVVVIKRLVLLAHN
ncbi:hypothetical protein TYRP_001552 [Tyrophagus putrescentiae]|nr:hypothetical protein TYRP_001552 [Tyrophagus putrescentiae]